MRLRRGRGPRDAYTPFVFDSEEIRVAELVAEHWRENQAVWHPVGYRIEPGPRGAINIECPSGMHFIALRRPQWQQEQIGVGVSRYPTDPDPQQ